ncbi:MAG: MFS transporter [Gammaproteobacteria bacterium]|nr:MFS transporter [Gammaproteobacteria bacterium]
MEIFMINCKLSGHLPLIIFACGVFYYCFAYILRVYTGVIYEPLVEELNLTASQFGVLTSLYYFSYSPMQVPAGVLVDRIGVRRSLLLACSIATIGSALFAFASSFSLVAIGRFMVGMGSAFAYVSSLKIATLWLPRKYIATAAGVTTASGMMAAIFTNIYFTRSLEQYGFAWTEAIPFLIGIFLFGLIALVVVDKAPDSGVEDDHKSAVSFTELWQYMRQIMLNRQILLIGLVGAFLYIPSSVFLDSWALPYLMHVKGLTLKDATNAGSIMLSGWILSSLLTGMLSDYMGNRVKPLIWASVISLVLSCVLLYGPVLPNSMLFLVMFLFGMGCGPHPLCFILAKENFPTQVAGTAISFANCLIMLGGFVFQPLLGYVLDFLQTEPVKGLAYSTEVYQKAMLIMPVTLLISIFLVWMIKDTYKRKE